MKTLIKSVEETKTHNVYLSLVKAGFNVKLKSTFNFSYDKDNSYLSITVEECEHRLTELFEITAKETCEAVLSMYTQSQKTHFEIRRKNDYAELVSDEVWNSYYISQE